MAIFILFQFAQLIVPYPEISVDFGTYLDVTKTNEEPLSMPGLGVGRGSFFVSCMQIRTIFAR